MSDVKEFPVDQFLDCIRNNNKTSQKFIDSAKGLNIYWIYEIIKICHNSIKQSKQSPFTKLNALLIVKDLIETCQVPCLCLIQIYIMPMIFSIGIENPNDKGETRGSRFFSLNGKTSKDPDVEKVGIKFLALCSQIMYVGALLKPKRIMQCEQLKQESDWEKHFQKYQKVGITGVPKQIKDLNIFNKKVIENGRQNFLKNLKGYKRPSQDYSQFFVQLIMDSLEQQTNPLFNQNHTISSINNDLDMRKLLKHGDWIITSPLIDQVSSKIDKLDNFMKKKNFLALLIDLFKMGDVEAILRILNGKIITSIATKISEVQGKNGLVQGEKIYPEFKGQYDGKKKFYQESLKAIQVVSQCCESANLKDEALQIIQCYKKLKIDKKFKFPENLMLDKIKKQFQQNFQYNSQRTEFIMKRIDKSELNSSFNKTFRSNKSNLGGASNTFNEINKAVIDCFQQIIKVPENQTELEARMMKVTRLKNKVQNDLEKIEQTNVEVDQDQLDELFENVDQITNLLTEVEKLQKNLKSKTINFAQFKQKYMILTQDYQIGEGTEKSDRSIQNNLRQSGQQIKNSLLKKKQLKQSTKTKSKLKKQQKQSKNQSLQFSQSESRVIKGQAQQPVSENSKPKNNPYQLNIPNGVRTEGSKLQENDDDDLLANKLSSIISNKKSKTQKGGVESQSKITQKEDKPKSSILRSKMEQRKKSIIEKKNQKSKLNSEISNPGSQIRPKQGQRSKVQRSAMEKKPSNIEVIPQIPIIEIKNLQQKPVSYLGVEELNRSQNMISEIKSNASKSGRINSSKKSNNMITNQKGYNYQSSLGQQQYSQLFKGEQSNIKKQSQVRVEVSNKQESHNNEYGLLNSKQNKRSVLVGSKNSRLQLNENIKGSKNMKSSSQKPRVLSLFGPRSKISSNAQGANQNPSQVQDSFHTYRNSELGINRSNISNNSIKKPKSQRSASLISKRYHKQSSFRQNIHGDNPLEKGSVIPSRIEKNSQIQLEDDDHIREPQARPLENSYHGINQIEKRIKNSEKADFKDCFKIENEVIGVQKNGLFEYGFDKMKSNLNSKPTPRNHEQYLLGKLRRQHEQQESSDNKQLANRIIQLKIQNSRLKNQALKKEFYNQRSKSNSSSSSLVNFSRSKDQNSSSPLTSKPSQKSDTSAISSAFTVVGDLIDEGLYSRFLNQFGQNQKVRKACIKNKSLLLTNENCQIGCMFTNFQQSTILLIYFTPKAAITNFQCSISTEPNLEIENESRPRREIPQNKQIKIQLNCKLKNIPYNLPMVNITFDKKNQRKNYSFYAPLTFNKFIKFQPLDSLNIFPFGKEKCLKTTQFSSNRKILKVDNLPDSYPIFGRIETQLKQKLSKFGASCKFKNNQFMVVLNGKGREKAILEARFNSETSGKMAQFLLYSLKKVMQN